MHLVTLANGSPGVIAGDDILDLRACAAVLPAAALVPSTMRTLLEAGDAGLIDGNDGDVFGHRERSAGAGEPIPCVTTQAGGTPIDPETDSRRHEYDCKRGCGKDGSGARGHLRTFQLMARRAPWDSAEITRLG